MVMASGLQPAKGRGALRLGAALVVSVIVAACGGQTQTQHAAADFQSPPLKAVAPTDISWVTKDWEATVQTKVACSFISDDPATVSGSAATYGVAGGPSSLLDNPAQISPREVLEFGCGRTSAPKTTWLIWYRNVNGIPVLLAHAVAHGSSSPASAQSSTPAVAAALSDCEQSGASSLLPGSNGTDSSSVPDNTPQVCGCWTGWLKANLTSAQMQTFVSDDGSATGAVQFSTQIGGMTSALQQCDLGQTPSGGGTSGGGSSGTATASAATQSSNAAATAGGSSGSGSGAANTVGASCVPGNQVLQASGLNCSEASRIVKAANRTSGCEVGDQYGSPSSGSCTVNGFQCKASLALPPGRSQGETFPLIACVSSSGSSIRWSES